MVKYFIVLFLIGIQINFSIEQVTHVPICAAPDGYDIVNLTKPDYWQFDKDGGCVYDTNLFEKCSFLFSFCHPLSDIEKCKNSSVCQWSIERPDDIFELGQYVYDPFYEKDVNGFYAVFGTGETVTNKYTNKTCNVTITMEFDCDSNVPWISDGITGIAPPPTTFSGISENNCDYFVKFPYAGACYRIQTTTVVDPTPAKICVPPAKGYNIKVLIEPPYWVFNIKSGCSIKPGSEDFCTLFVAFCKPFESLAFCNGSSGCIKYPNQPQYSVIVGNYSPDPFISAEVNGFLAAYPAGSEIINPYTNKTCSLSLEVIFDCDADAEWKLNNINEPGVAPEPTSFTSISETSCKIIITVPYSGACIKIIPPPNKPNKGLSTGSILIILFVCTLFVYFVVGFGYNSLVDKQSGLKALPHYEFWVITYDYMKEGFSITWKKLTCQRQSELVYNSI